MTIQRLPSQFCTMLLPILAQLAGVAQDHAPEEAQDRLVRGQYKTQVESVVASARQFQKSFGEMEKTLDSFFPRNSRRSPFYAWVEMDFKAFRASVKAVGEYAVTLTNDKKSYTRLFSVGLLKTVDTLKPGDENWERARTVAGRIAKTISVSQDEIERLGPLRESLFGFAERMDSVDIFRKELLRAYKQFSEEIKDISVRSRNLIRKFGSVDAALGQFQAYNNGDSLRRNLQENNVRLAALVDSTRSLENSLDYLLKGISKPGDKTRVWDLYQWIVNRNAILTGEILQTMKSAPIIQDQLGSSLDLLDEFGALILEMDRGVAELTDRKKEAEDHLERCDSLLTGLLEGASPKISTDQMPYRELKRAYQNCENIVSGTGQSLVNIQRVRQRLITNAGKMEKLGDEESELFDQLGREFGEVLERALQRQEQFTGAAETFNEVILSNFKNTPQYWELRYRFEENKERDGTVTVEENFGYLYDPHEYPERPYHGKLTTLFQLRLRKLKLQRSDPWQYYLIFEGTIDYPIEGMLILDGDSLISEVHRDDHEGTEETTDDGRWKFVWEVPVEAKLLERIAASETAVLRVHLISLSHRVNITLYRQKLFRDYYIPIARLKEWGRLLKGDASFS